jgi:predicted RNase H-like HicB family nuclease
MKKSFHVLIEKDADGYFVASVPALPGCHTQAKSLDELDRRVREAIALYLEATKGAPSSLRFIGIQQIEI